MDVFTGLGHVPQVSFLKDVFLTHLCEMPMSPPQQPHFKVENTTRLRNLELQLARTTTTPPPFLGATQGTRVHFAAREQLRERYIIRLGNSRLQKGRAK
jgi:hypothetical protein